MRPERARRNPWPMSQPSKSAQWLVWGSLGLTITAIVVAFIIEQGRQADRPARLLPGNGPPAGLLPTLFPVGDFRLTNQNNLPVTRADLRGQLWLVDIIFTRCAGPCPEMTRRMAELQTAVPTNRPVKFVTLTTDPEHDTPVVLQSYGRRFGAAPARWYFLTGTKQQIADLATRGLRFTALEKEPDKQENPNDLFIHSTLFVLVDQQGQARAVFESDDADLQRKVLAAIEHLLQKP